ncbi:Mll2521 protein [alpha proteobacterium U9-1i]|nr:Mll2521 protein [alpha proteobacterium U9-1i]
MAKIDLTTAPSGQGTRYPAPYDEPCKKRRWLRLGDAAGLTQFGVNVVTLDPGVWSSQRHWHEKEDEFVFMLEGELVLVTDAGEAIMRPGDCAGFKAGVHDGHKLENRSDTPARFLVVGGRDDEDWGEYSDIDMKFWPKRYSGGGGYTRKNGDKI